ncbi:MAG: pirin family protein [Bacteroidales bacterium]|jgi:redox-sensitive bicupin YhaK (pirin superfamily)
MKQRKCIRIDRGKDAVDGAGVKLRRVLGLRTVREYDPFLMLDGFDSKDSNDYIKGFPWHPHRGIETVTYLIEGTIDHNDSLGNEGTIGALECQWMTAGSGIIHQEMPKASARMLGCQLWVNIPAKDKMTHPAYRDISAADVPVFKEDTATVRLLSGVYKGHTGAFDGGSLQVRYLDIDLAPEAEWIYNQTPDGHTLFLYLLEGTLLTNGLEEPEPKGCALLMGLDKVQEKPDQDNQAIVVQAGAAGARFILLSGKPLMEPISWGGPIVMNTREELDLAFRELENGTFIKH